MLYCTVLYSTVLCSTVLHCGGGRRWTGEEEEEDDRLGRRRRRMMDWGGEAREGNEDREGRWRGGGRGEDFFNGIW